jgi:excisionase family DNA binding protein
MNHLLTIEEAAGRLKIAVKTMREWLRTRKLPGVKMGKYWRVREQDIEAFVTSRLRLAPEPAVEHPSGMTASTQANAPANGSTLAEDTLLALVRALLPEGHLRPLHDLGITTFPLAEVNAILERHGLMVRAVRGQQPQRLVTCSMPGGREERYGLFELRPLPTGGEGEP